MMANDHSGARSLSAITGEIADAELNIVAGGDKKTTTPKPTPKPTAYMVYTMEQVLVTSY
jgi:hypothetical protein